MPEPSIFTRIINGELPCHKIYEDDKTLAFLDIHPSVEGFTVVISKNQVDGAQDLPDADYIALMNTVKKVMQRMVQVYGPSYRPCVIIEGFEVAHAHVKILPCRNVNEFHAPQNMSEPDHAALAEVAKKLAF